MTEFQEVTTFTIECPNPDCPDPTSVKVKGLAGPVWVCFVFGLIFADVVQAITSTEAPDGGVSGITLGASLGRRSAGNEEKNEEI